jgi:hypothetical protein
MLKVEQEVAQILHSFWRRSFYNQVNGKNSKLSAPRLKSRARATLPLPQVFSSEKPLGINVIELHKLAAGRSIGFTSGRHCAIAADD